MSPTVLRIGGYRFFFFSLEEHRPHIHVSYQSGEAKIWLSPGVALAHSHGLTPQQISTVTHLAREHQDEFITAWQRHFGA